MKIYTREVMARGVAERWHEEQCRSNYNTNRLLTSGICAALTALGNSATPEQVDRVIGSSYWTTLPECSECNHPQPEVMAIGNGEETVYICRECFLKADSEWAVWLRDQHNNRLEG